MDYTLNCNGRLLSLETPQVMGILNVTPDSFFADSRKQSEEDIVQRCLQIVGEGGCIIDVGACSTRPDSQPVGEAEETERLRFALPVIRRELPDAILSIDTFRPAVARMAVEEYGADIINDVGNHTSPFSVPNSQSDMFRMVSRLHVPYIYTSSKAMVKEVMLDCAEAVATLRSLGQKDIILDPGFGFGKTLEDNYRIVSQLERLQALDLPLLVGFSRKSMIWKLLQTSPDEALNGTTALNTLALMKGASILRVHDVREAVETVKIVHALNSKR